MDIPDDWNCCRDCSSGQGPMPEARQFYLKGEPWLGITIPFVGDTALDAVVDT